MALNPPGMEQVTRDRLGGLCFTQPKEGYRFSIDSVLLADFIKARKGPVADLGAGCGVLGVLLWQKGLAGPYTGVELDELAARCCQENYHSHQVPGRVLNQDLTLAHAELKPGHYSLVVSNPPFTRAGGGKAPSQSARARARHELALDTPALCQAAARLLPKGGCFTLCFPPSRLCGMLKELGGSGLEPKRMRLVHGRKQKPASLVLLETRRGGNEGLVVEPPLYVYGQGQNYTSETASIYDRLCGPASGPA
jgi:tRNA1Val (adenine37-N6)-methyltransferase